MTRFDRQEIRRQAHAARKAQPEKDAVSHQILCQALALPEFQAAHSVLFYVSVRDEVRTRAAIEATLGTEKRVAVPYCVGDQLQLFWLNDWSQLTPSRFGLLEPRPELRVGQEVRPDEIDLVLAPGVAFDRHGNRMGHGKGFYDRLLAHMPHSTALVGLAYDCQVFAQLETQSHDVPMDQVVTQSRVYVGRRRRGGAAE